MSLDDNDPLYDGKLANDALGRLINAEWDEPRSLTTSCVGGKHFARSVALFAGRLEEGTTAVSSPSDVIRLADSTSSWARYIDPALSIFRMPPVRVGIALWECSTHIAYLVQNGPGWRAVVQPAAVDRILELVKLNRSAPRSATIQKLDPSFLETPPEGASMGSPQDSPRTNDVNRAISRSLGDFAELWLEEGFTAEEARPWADVGLLPLHARRWHGWPVEGAILFALQALRPADVAEWQRTYPDEIPLDWVGAGIPLVAASEWVDHGYRPTDAANLIEQGVRSPRHVH